MELVRAHDAANVITATCFVQLRDAGPEAGGYEHQLGAEEGNSASPVARWYAGHCGRPPGQYGAEDARRP